MSKQSYRKAYHRFFEDYAEIRTPNEKGREVIRRVYVGQYFKTALDDRTHRRRKGIILALFLLSAVLCLYGGLTAPASGARFTALLTMASLLSLVLLGVSVFYRLTAPREMEKRVYRDSSERLRTTGFLSAVCLLFTAVGMLITALGNEAYVLSDNGTGILAFTLAGAAALGLALLEKKTGYDVLPPKHQRPEGAAPIRYEAPD